jgi:hypothetical protein
MARISLKSSGNDLIGRGLLSVPASKVEPPPEACPTSAPARKKERQLQERPRQLFQPGDAFNLFFPLDLT